EADKERRVRWPGERWRIALDGAPGRARVDADRQCVLRAVDLDVDVVARLVVTQPGDQAKRAARQAKENGGRADVAHGLVLRETERRSGGGDLDRFLFAQPAGAVAVLAVAVLTLRV